MDVYRRYFKVTEGPLVAAISENKKVNDDARVEYKKIIKEIGAKEDYYTFDVQPSGFMFDKAPDGGIFKKNKNGSYYPKKNCKDGRELAKRIESVKTASSGSPLSSVGLHGNKFPRIFGNGKAYYETMIVIPSDPPVAFVSVPWFDEDPEKIEQYKIDRSTGNNINRDLSAILWEPTADMAEVKKWEVDKAVEEWNESLK